MKWNKVKRMICLRIFSALLMAYLILMTGFTVFLLNQQKKQEIMANVSYGMQVNNSLNAELKEYLKSRKKISDLINLQDKAVSKMYTVAQGLELAIYTEDFSSVSNTNDYWFCGYRELQKNNKFVTKYGFIDPDAWFGKEDLKELEKYLQEIPVAEKVGDISSYTVNIAEFYVEGGMIVPVKITVTPYYAKEFDESGRVIKSCRKQSEENIVFTVSYINKYGLKAHTDGYITYTTRDNSNDELRNMVLDKYKVMDSIADLKLQSVKQITPFKYRFYQIVPYNNYITVDDDGIYRSDFWTVIAVEVNLLDKCGSMLLFVWLSCFIIFTGVAILLIMQTIGLYNSREKLESYRVETTSALAHELKTPLSIISGYAQNLKENIQSDKREYYADNIYNNVERMDRIIINMLEFTKYDSDKLVPRYTEVPLQEVCTVLINRYTQQCIERSITIKSDGEAVIKTDYMLIEKVLDNFFTNALANTEEGGEISIKIINKALEFYNSGSHIPEEELKDIWEPFVKSDKSRSKSKGTGLGLSIVGNILKSLGFTYGVFNKEDGVVFWFRW
ncbi:MAG: two-component sensor histidine kinase [Anaerocolumna sp.]|jgi:signal transduction histidine kinase|nr:two-component sensor histidine kinase [Anaerocolumna sp.]